MSVFPKPAELFGVYYGFLVTGGAKTLPASGTGHIFTVTGGRVIVTSLTGIVTIATGAIAVSLSIGNTPTGGSAGATTLATATSIVNLAVGNNVSMPPLSSAGAAQALIVGAVGVATPINAAGLAVVPAGTIDVVTATTDTGAITYSITYVAYDAGASITAL
jgi:hypothetical protein